MHLQVSLGALRVCSSMFTERKPRYPLKSNGERGFLSVNRLETAASAYDSSMELILRLASAIRLRNIWSARTRRFYFVLVQQKVCVPADHT